MGRVRTVPPALVLAGAVAGLAAQFAVLGVLAASVGLGAPGWIIGLCYGLTANMLAGGGTDPGGLRFDRDRPTGSP